MKRIFEKNQVLTLPNLLSVVRIALIPVIVWLYSAEKNHCAAIGVIALSGATDMIDGWIARRFHMISDFGKILDPLADKLTQAAVLLCLLSKYRQMTALIIIFAVCELGKFALGIFVKQKYNEVNGAKWYGKANTVVIYATMMLLILFPDISASVVNLLMGICGTVIIAAHILYLRFYNKILKEKGRNYRS